MQVREQHIQQSGVQGGGSLEARALEQVPTTRDQIVCFNRLDLYQNLPDFCERQHKSRA